jgi:molecular chaperone DnaK
MPQIEVAFNIDANGILNVSAKDKGTGKEQSIRIQSSSGLSEDEIKNMVKEGETNAADDAKRADLVKAKNGAENLVYTTEKLVAEHGDKAGAVEKEKLQKELEKLKKAMAGEDKAAIDAAMQAVLNASHKISEAMYKASAGDAEKVAAAARAAHQGAPSAPGGATPSPESGPPPGGPGENVVDADFKVVDGDK